MQLWVVCLVLFFGLAELYQWLQGFTFPLPVLIVAGAVLAVASNPKQETIGLPSSSPSPPSSVPSLEANSLPNPAPPIIPPVLHPASPSQTTASPQLPNLTPPPRSISFTVQPPRES